MATITLSATPTLLPVTATPTPLVRNFLARGVAGGTSMAGGTLNVAATLSSNGSNLEGIGIIEADGITVSGDTIFLNGTAVAIRSVVQSNELRFTFTASATVGTAAILANHLSIATDVGHPDPAVYASFALTVPRPGGTSDRGDISIGYGTGTGDVLGIGPAPNNLVAGGAGDDVLYIPYAAPFNAQSISAFYGGAGRDRVGTFTPRTLGYTVDLGRGDLQHLNDEVGSIRLVSIEDYEDQGTKGAVTVIGTGSANALTVRDGEVRGLGGDDLLRVIFSGKLDGGAGIDTALLPAVYGTGGSLVDLRVAGQQNIGDFHVIELVGIENLQGAGTNDRLHGDDDPNRIEGGFGDDYLYGHGGRDVLVGGPGANHRQDGGSAINYLDGGDGDDLLVAGTGGNLTYYFNRPIYGTYSGGTGVDTLDLTGTVDRLRIDLQESFQQGGDRWDPMTVSGIENLVGNNKVNLFSGNAEANVFTGGTANDEFRGRGGDDTLNGGNGNDILYGGEGVDVLNGGDGIDTLHGGEFADIMRGGLGNDVYVVDQVDDQVIELAGGGTDEVVTSASFALPNQVEKLTVAAGVTTGVTLTGNGLGNTITGGAGADTLVGGGGRDVLTGGGGADIFRYLAAADSLPGGTGRDTIRDFAQGQDRIDLAALAPVGGPLAFIGQGRFTGGGPQVRFAVLPTSTLIQADVDGDGVTDIDVALASPAYLTAADFLLG